MAAKKELIQMQGTIEKIARNGRAFLIDEEWYSVYKPSQANGAEAGDYVEFEYETVQKGGQQFHNIQGMVTVKGASSRKAASSRESAGSVSGDSQEASQARYAAKERHIIRQNVLGHATAIVMGLNPGALEESVEDVITVAKQLEEYVTGE